MIHIRVSKIKARWLRRVVIVASFPFVAAALMAQAIGLWALMVIGVFTAHLLARIYEGVLCVWHLGKSGKEQWK